MHHQFKIQQFYVLPTQCIYVFCVDLRTNSDHFPIQYWLTGFYNRDGVCLLRGMDWSLYIIKVNLKYLTVLNIITLDKYVFNSGTETQLGLLSGLTTG